MIRRLLLMACVLAVDTATASNAATELPDRPSEYCGIFFTMFESSVFTPCDSKEAWWLRWSEGSQPKGPLNSPGWYYIVVEGTLSPPGRHGHMGQYSRQLSVTRTLAFRPVARDSGCAADPLDVRVAALIDKTMNRDSEQQAFKDLESLGCAAVPSIISRMDDRRMLPKFYIALKNNSAGAFEGFRQYTPEEVVDALAPILNQLTGQHFGFIYNGASPAERRKTVDGWRQFLHDTPADALCGTP